MTANYTRLFTIEILHEYFLNRKCNDIEVIPADDCKEVSGKMNILWRTVENQLIALIKENDEHEPFINIPPKKSWRKYFDQTVFRFYVKLKKPLFFNYTNIDFSYSSGKKFYFSNLANNDQNGILNLTAPLNDYAGGTTYLPGALVKDAANGNVYEAITKNGTKKKNALADPSLWTPKGLLHLSKRVHDHSISKTYSIGDLAIKPGTNDVFEAVKKHISRSDAELNDVSLWVLRGNGQLQYATGNDSIEFCASNYIFKVSLPITKADIVIAGFNYNSAAPAYDVPAREKEVRTFKDPTTFVSLNLAGLKPGKYEIEINNERRTIYFDPILSQGNIVGVVEIYNHLPGTHDYSLLDNEEKIRNLKYNIQFANRRVLWKYKPKDGKAEKIIDIGDTGYVFKLNRDAFISATPIPLTENVLKTLKLEFNTKDFTMFPLPNPNCEHLGRCVQNDYDYWCSEVYLNY